ncbi:PAN2-PAN3 deadenylation complex subunit pan3-like isoform X2 [Liolophura sinensis]|uniref:PAN2-PAN3 deadenylation complex subunit pan3-like isoform X2 n=1 Tax=Liolophura sinensis TaxID=3198878 RepID=UPI003158B5C0
MTSAAPAGRKPALCRFFVNTRSCVYGEECQFLHQNPDMMSGVHPPAAYPSSLPAQPESVDSHGDTIANNGDQFFNATFNSGGQMPEFQQFIQRPRPRTRNNPLTSMARGMKPFVPQMNRGEPGFADSFAALNLANSSNKSSVNPGANEFVPKAASISHSSSSPSFSSFNNITPMPTSSTLSTGVSPTPSPGMSPADSPLMMRRNASPVTPLQGPNNNAGTIQENVGGTTYFYSAEDFAPQYQGMALPNFTMFPALPPHIAHMKVKANMPQFFMPDEIKMDLLNRHALTLAQLDPEQNPDIPPEVDNYHNLFPLEPPQGNNLQKSTTFGYPTTCYKAVNTKDGMTYCLKRIHGFRLVNTKCMAVIDMWKKLYHPNIVQLREVFTTKAFGDHSMVFVYDYHPAAETLMARHFNNPTHLNGFTSPYNLDGSARPYSAGKGANGPRQHAGLLPESLIWAYVVQLSSALRAIHAAGLACRAMDPTKILICSKSRLRINCMGIFDVLTFDSSQNNPVAMMPHYQQDDLVSLGKVVLALACNSVLGIQREHIQTSMELVARNYSADLKNLILYLLTNQTRPRSINDIMPMIGARFYTQLDAAQLRNDVIENELAKEVENGRLMRLLCKLGTVNERPEFNMDTTWSETGDRYMLKLFRDYLFHQVDENGAPWVDMAHIVQCLNKLDAGVPEKVCLMSRDEQNIITVSYTELKRCFQSAFSELLSASHQSGFS